MSHHAHGDHGRRPSYLPPESSTLAGRGFRRPHRHLPRFDEYWDWPARSFGAILEADPALRVLDQGRRPRFLPVQSPCSRGLRGAIVRITRLSHILTMCALVPARVRSTAEWISIDQFPPAAQEHHVIGRPLSRLVTGRGDPETGVDPRAAVAIGLALAARREGTYFFPAGRHRRPPGLARSTGSRVRSGFIRGSGSAREAAFVSAGIPQAASVSQDVRVRTFTNSFRDRRNLRVHDEVVGGDASSRHPDVLASGPTTSRTVTTFGAGVKPTAFNSTVSPFTNRSRSALAHGEAEPANVVPRFHVERVGPAFSSRLLQLVGVSPGRRWPSSPSKVRTGCRFSRPLATAFVLDELRPLGEARIVSSDTAGHCRRRT